MSWRRGNYMNNEAWMDAYYDWLDTNQESRIQEIQNLRTEISNVTNELYELRRTLGEIQLSSSSSSNSSWTTVNAVSMKRRRHHKQLIQCYKNQIQQCEQHFSYLNDELVRLQS